MSASDPVDHPATGTTTRATLAERLQTLGYSRRRAGELVDTVFDLIAASLQSVGHVKLARFGKFEVQVRAPRQGRNPRTGQEVPIRARRVVVFRPAPALRERLTEALGGGPEGP